MNANMKLNLSEMLQEIKKTTYIDPKRVSDAQAIGILMSQYFSQDGKKILQSAWAGLEDANFHSENRVIKGMIDKL